MEIITLDRQFFENETIDVFESAIWTERYKGDGDFKIVVPDTEDMRNKLYRGVLMKCEGSSEPMILETRDIKDGLMETTGITLAQWLNNRFIRASADYTIRDWQISQKPATALRYIVQQMCIGGPYLDGTNPIGIPVGILDAFKIDGLQAVGVSYPEAVVTFSVPYGPVYDALKQIADTFEIGMKITLDGAFEDYYILSFTSYYGLDRSSNQAVNPLVEFSKDMDTFTNIHDLESITDYRNYLFEFPPTNVNPAYAMGAALTDVSGAPESPFDLRIFQGFADDITTDGLTDAQIYNLLLQKAISESKNHKQVALVDGEIVQTGQINYGEHYFMGDIVDVIGNTGTRQTARITEYIRSQDSAGERAYPALTMID